MKKLLIILLLLCAAGLWAQDEAAPGEPETMPESVSLLDEEMPAEPAKKKFRFKNRMVELSINARAGFSNDFVTAADLLKETAVVNIDDFLDGFRLDFGANADICMLNFNWKDKWGFGLGMNLSATGNVTIPENVLNFKQAQNEDFGAGAAVFYDLGIPVFFHIQNFKIKFRPAAFLTVAYAEPGLTYNYRTVTNAQGNKGTRISVDYDMYVYAPVPLEGIVEDGKFYVEEILQNFDWSSLGYDFGIGVEYPLYSFLDIGADITNMPLVNAKLSHYMRLRDSIWVDTSYIDINDMIAGEEFPEDAYSIPEGFDPSYGTGSVKIYRPFKMLFYANYRPFESPILSLIPTMGFSINPLYVQKGSFEGGISARCDLSNIFITTIGINYHDRMWKNSLDFVLNLRAFELDFGVAFQSEQFVKSWQGAGVAVNVGVKLGW
jgi:hypothetical protein